MMPKLRGLRRHQGAVEQLTRSTGWGTRPARHHRQCPFHPARRKTELFKDGKTAEQIKNSLQLAAFGRLGQPRKSQRGCFSGKLKTPVGSPARTYASMAVAA